MLGGAGGRLSDLHTANHPGGGEGRAAVGGSVQLPDLDKYYLKAAAMGLYGDDQSGHPRNLDVQIQGDTAIKRWAKPFEWLDGDAARSYGETTDEFLFWANMHELSPSTVPFDGHSESGGVFMFPLPITMVYAAALDGRLTGADPRNTLAGSQAGALCFYGRGLTFSEEDAVAFSRALHPSRLTPTQFPLNVSRGDLAVIRDVVSRAIARAWGDDEASPGSGFRPGRLARREGDGATVPAVVAKHSYNVATYVNHATSAALDGKLLGGMVHRDARDNVDHMSPPEGPDGKPLFHPNGKPRSVVEPHGRNFKIDGYAVTYKVGVTWKFMLGFDADAGLTMYHLRVVLPPSRAHPKGREVPYLYRAFIPNFGTDYSATNLGNPSSFLFKESHFGDATGLHKPSICSGATLPVFRSKHGAYLGKAANATQYYSTYGLGIPDPYSEMLGHHAPMQAFPNQKVDNGLIPQAFCIQELDLGHNMWHMYTSQHLRALQVSQSTISDAYNVVVNFKLKSDGKFSVGEILHGKPGVGTHAIPGVGGQYASGGKGGLATNHMHWHVIALEPHLRMDTKGVVNRLHVSDMVAPADEPADWFGTAFHRRTTVVADASETELLKYDFNKQRYWRIAAVNESTGEDMGSLKLTSAHFNPPILPGNRPAKNLAPEDTYAGNHWWLTQDVHVVNATVRRDSTVLNARGTEPGYDPGHSTGHPLRAHPKFDRPMVFCTIKVHHEVVEEEMPAQSAFANIDVNVQPHNLYGFNPNILVRYQPEYNDWYENTWMKSYTPPYTSEFDEGH